MKDREREKEREREKNLMEVDLEENHLDRNVLALIAAYQLGLCFAG